MTAESQAQVAQAFSRVRDSFIDAVASEIVREVPAIDDPSLRRLLTASVTENVMLFVDVLANDIDPYTVALPSGAAEHARRLAQKDVPLSSLLRVYRFGQKRLLNAYFNELPTMSPTETSATLIAALNISGALHDRIVEQVEAIYRDELTRRARDEEAVRQQWITRLLDDADPDLPQAESTLGYRLAGTHLAVEAWADEAATPGDVSRLVPLLRRTFARSDDVLVAAGERQQRIWLRLSAIDRIDTGGLHDDLKRARLRIAVGRPGRDLDGFRSTARTAARVKALALCAPDVPRVTWFDDVAPVALLADDPLALSAFVATALGPLAGRDTRYEELRQTLRVYFATNRSVAETAKSMMFHRNTIHYRIQQIEQHGLRLDTDTLNIQLALAICHWYGPAVLCRTT